MNQSIETQIQQEAKRLDRKPFWLRDRSRRISRHLTGQEVGEVEAWNLSKPYFAKLPSQSDLERKAIEAIQTREMN